MTNYSDLKFISYLRKSTEGEERQVQSISDQRKVLSPIIEQRALNIIIELSDKKTAKQPGRDGFNKMIGMIEKGEANAIICWKLNRLARNPIDEGKLKWLLQKGFIKRIVTPYRDYLPTDNVIITSVEFGEANQRSIEIGVDVKRRYVEKANSGDLPTGRKLGYIWDPDADQGEKTLLPDHRCNRFQSIQHAIRNVAAGKQRPLDALKWLNDEDGGKFTTPKSKRLGGLPLNKSRWYGILNDPFYCGDFEYPGGSGIWIKGNHEAMITKEEHSQIKIILGNDKRPRPSKNDFPFIGMMKCGECGASVTAEDKWQCICTNCKHKFSCKHVSQCPECNTRIEEMDKPTISHYIYYRCTKKCGFCAQKTMSAPQLEKQVSDFLSRIEISDRFKQWLLKKINEENQGEVKERQRKLNILQRQYDDCVARIGNLTDVLTSPENADGATLSQQEYREQKKRLTDEKDRINRNMKKFDQGVDTWTELAERTFNFAQYARHWFENGDVQQKRSIMRALGLNLTIQNRIWTIHDPSLFLSLKNTADQEPTILARIEPTETAKVLVKTADLEKIWDKSPSLQGWRESNPRHRIWRPVYYHCTTPL